MGPPKICSKIFGCSGAGWPAGTLSVAAEESPDRWFGLTYREDMAEVAEELKRLCETGFYPKNLF